MNSYLNEADIDLLRNFLNIHNIIPDISWDLDPAKQLDNEDEILLKNWDGMILNENIGFELGDPKHHSTAVALLKEIPEKNTQIPNKIFLYGPDIPQIKEKSFSFGLLVILFCKNINDKNINPLHRGIIFTNQVPGFAQVSNPKTPRFRIHKDYLRNNYSFKNIGKFLINHYKNSFPDIIQAIEINLFVGKDNIIILLQEIRSKMRKMHISLFKQNISKDLKNKMREECNLEIDCRICDNLSICSEIQKIARLRKNQQ